MVSWVEICSCKKARVILYLFSGKYFLYIRQIKGISSCHFF
jgi:hypothetical protein